MKLTHTQIWAVRTAYRARENSGDGWTNYSAGELRMIKTRTVRTLVRLGLAEMHGGRSEGRDGFYGRFRLTLAGCLFAAELRSQDEARVTERLARIKAARETPGGTP